MCWWTSEIARGDRAVANRVIVSEMSPAPDQLLPTIPLPTDNSVQASTSERGLALGSYWRSKLLIIKAHYRKILVRETLERRMRFNATVPILYE